jgi:hypothetical protein
MSGGRFDYQQWRLSGIAEEIKEILDKQGTEDTTADPYWVEKYPEDRYHPTYPVEINEAMKKAIKLLDTAYIYVQRLDWYLSGDDGLESFKTRLKEDLEELKNKQDEK